ncbi:hypothetical protein [Chitinophaga arvensicola]|uniref:Uncharacterized protein n=1 Tax=Chitinophaga arvensicola TaxID=29529 RepID=A0A1I0R6C7_9BACT|nr:hypothetical protein [Chitinophaga arvensicola]SEW36162.1 hypothetical protein SAMN04488122_2356 [Chitinophaga arvensicola]
MKKILFLFLLAGLFYACKKDSIGTKPILSFKSYSIDSVISSTQQMVLTMNVEDGDGDIEDSIWIGPVFKSNGPNADTFYSVKKMGDIGANKGNKVKAEVQILLRSIEFKLVQNTGVDSIHFVVFVRDNAGHFSDTISTPKIPYNY